MIVKQVVVELLIAIHFVMYLQSRTNWFRFK